MNIFRFGYGMISAKYPSSMPKSGVCRHTSQKYIYLKGNTESSTIIMQDVIKSILSIPEKCSTEVGIFAARHCVHETFKCSDTKQGIYSQVLSPISGFQAVRNIKRFPVQQCGEIAENRQFPQNSGRKSAFFRHHHCIRETSKCSDTKWGVNSSVYADFRSSRLTGT